MVQGTFTKQRLQPGRIEKARRWLKLKYLLLLRAKGGPAKVAKGFGIGLFVEMFTLPTGGLAAVLILPLVYLFRASLPGALIGFLFGKIIYVPMMFLNKKVGSLVVPKGFVHHIHFQPHWLEKLLKGAMDLIVGGMIVGAVLGVLVYFPIKLLLGLYTARRKEKRLKRKAQLLSVEKGKL
ncbi:DUF2062 domain-containing protein [Paenibacillus aurantius]|uniref:DUF2062 domain-containing protein n=1 Tax=Paenibacillus aurantius TaxID=2918900 RepID=A0AA96LEK8_9BACL|nr:DUF2062 domain-containing protein [Paenibacillus aurantius]WJH34946.1 DUF2062 domain-containing protein [Paenibacillus sp. CC-CFT747]WNQ10187.1 DUF2062 domain-containing protein [Paenibacillus aurantius]